jgi:hypothetical protein
MQTRVRTLAWAWGALYGVCFYVAVDIATDYADIHIFPDLVDGNIGMMFIAPTRGTFWFAMACIAAVAGARLHAGDLPAAGRICARGGAVGVVVAVILISWWCSTMYPATAGGYFAASACFWGECALSALILMCAGVILTLIGRNNARSHFSSINDPNAWPPAPTCPSDSGESG